MTTANNREKQEDASTRATFQLKKYTPAINWYLDAGYSREKLNYDNIVADIYSRSIFQRVYIYPHLRWKKFRNLQLEAGVQTTADEATSPKYSRKTQQRFGLPVSLQYQLRKRLQLSLLLRPETVNFQYKTFSFSVNGNYELLKQEKLAVYANAGKNYNYPTLNDLYWYPGGNPNLLPENAISTESGLNSKISSENKKLVWNNSASVFSTVIDNYIQWQQASQGYWSPQNLKKVWSRGAEVSSKISAKWAKNTFSFGAAYSYVRSTSQRALNDLDKTVGRQLIYVPAHTAQTSAVYSYGKSIFSAQYIYTHYRYTPTYFLPGYGLLNLQAETGITVKKLAFRASLKCNNVLNKSYQAIEWRPMPGRWFEAGLAIKFSNSL
jgi:iron complex outermembrane receptor protein